MKKRKIVLLFIIIAVTLSVLIITTEKKDESREVQIENFEKKYLPKKLHECLKEHGYSLKAPTAEHKKECEDYVKQIWHEQKVLNGIDE